ncbi:MAG: division/cell wall cluster transcriptional repressor MraZ [Solirubrobacteraceae bacterium]
MAFRGVFDHILDSKNRLTVPRPYRDAFPSGVVLAIPPDCQPCIWIARPEDYESYTLSALAELSPLSAKRLDLERFFFGNSHDADLDGRERVMLPSAMIEHASLTKNVAVVGAGERLECWDKAAWEAYRPALMSGAGEVTASAERSH